MTLVKTYSELSKFTTLKDRYDYLKLNGVVGKDTFGFDRWLNQKFYKLPEWRSARDSVIIRDNGCELGIDGFDIIGPVYVHHMNPITKEDVLLAFDQGDLGDLVNPQYLISSSDLTHKAIHYGNADLLPKNPIIRMKNDTCPWKK